MTERRYTEEEVAAIFERAAEAQQASRRQLPAGEGMTLADLQSIGREVGIPAELVAQAAQNLERGGEVKPRRFFGLPIGVGRTIEFDRRITDAEWEQLVVDLRETFDARGVVRYDGPFRQWTNGNLQALLEPTPTGHRLKLQTVRSASRASMTAGVLMTAVSGVMVAVAAISGHAASAIDAVWPLALVGSTLFGAGAVRLPGWARLRGRQMEGVSARLARGIAAGDPPPALPPGAGEAPGDARSESRTASSEDTPSS